MWEKNDDGFLFSVFCEKGKENRKSEIPLRLAMPEFSSTENRKLKTENRYLNVTCAMGPGQPV
jgi:hypothetical protein